MIGIRIILNIKSESLIRCHHRQRLVVHVAGNATFCHLLYHLVGILTSLTKQTHQIQVMRTAMVCILMIQNCHGQILQSGIVLCHNLLTAFQQALIPFHLNQSQCGHYVRHITLIPRANNIILPCTQFCLCQCIFILTVK